MVFKPQALKDELIFRIPQRGASDVFVTDAFVKLVEQHRLKGFTFKPMWSNMPQATAAR
jgi:hypothetical protein